jgi:hypothetical protein
MDFDANTLLAGLLVSSIGFVLMAYGRKTGRVVHVCAGVVLLIYPYFVPGALLVLAIGVLLLALLWLGVRAGL